MSEFSSYHDRLISDQRKINLRLKYFSNMPLGDGRSREAANIYGRISQALGSAGVYAEIEDGRRDAGLEEWIEFLGKQSTRFRSIIFHDLGIAEKARKKINERIIPTDAQIEQADETGT